MSDYDARDVLDKYMAVLASGDAIVRDAVVLSHPKDIVKFVLRHCIRTIESADQQKFLREAYLALASFQALSEEERRAVVLLEEIGPLALDGKLEDAQAERISDMAAPLRAVIAKLKTEAALLAQELKSLPGAGSPV